MREHPERGALRLGNVCTRVSTSSDSFCVHAQERSLDFTLIQLMQSYRAEALDAVWSFRDPSRNVLPSPSTTTSRCGSLTSTSKPRPAKRRLLRVRMSCPLLNTSPMSEATMLVACRADAFQTAARMSGSSRQDPTGGQGRHIIRRQGGLPGVARGQSLLRRRDLGAPQPRPCERMISRDAIGLSEAPRPSRLPRNEGRGRTFGPGHFDDPTQLRPEVLEIFLKEEVEATEAPPHRGAAALRPPPAPKFPCASSTALSAEHRQ